MTIVPARRTPIGAVELAETLARAHAAVFSEPPSYNRLGMAWSQIWGETGAGQKSWNNNLGNVKCTPGWPECMRLNDEHDDWQTNQKSIYRAYTSHEAAAKDYWKLIQGRYSSALPGFDAGDSAIAAAELIRKGYAEVSVAHYEKGLRYGFQEYKRRFQAGTSWSKVIPLLASACVLAAAIRWL